MPTVLSKPEHPTRPTHATNDNIEHDRSSGESSSYYRSLYSLATAPLQFIRASIFGSTSTSYTPMPARSDIASDKKPPNTAVKERNDSLHLPPEIIPASPEIKRRSHVPLIKTPIISSIISLVPSLSKDGNVTMFPNGQSLREYQSKDLLRLCVREAGESVFGVFNETGYILAYYMGLGKTVLTLALICSRPKPPESFASPATLVVCPNVGIMSHWRSEIDKFAPHLSCLWYHGKGRDSDPRDADIVLVTYAQVTAQYSARSHYIAEQEKVHRRKWSEGTTESPLMPPIKFPPKLCPLFTCHFHRVVLDEAHQIRNPATKGAAACCDLKKSHGLCLTGTPAQNSVRDFYVLFKFLDIANSRVNDLEMFTRSISAPIRQGRPEKATALLKKILSGFMIQMPLIPRNGGKPEVDLPKRHKDQFIRIHLTPQERHVYEYIRDTHYFTSQLAKIIRLRQVCDHPFLLCKALMQDDAEAETAPDDMRIGLDDDSKFTANKSLDDHETYDVVFTPRTLPHDLRMVRNLFKDTYLSSKLNAVYAIVRYIHQKRKGEKIIIFSHFTTVLSLIGELLEEKGIEYTSYTGTMSVAEREHALERIATEEECVIILISIKAGGSGLNIVACNNVILTEPWWNPFVEEQAISRVHRIGQTREVHVYRIVVEDSMENYIIETQDAKLKTIGDILG